MTFTTVLIFKNVPKFSSVNIRNVRTINTPKGGVTQKHRKKLSTKLVFICVVMVYILRICFWYLFQNWYRFYKDELATKMQIWPVIFSCETKRAHAHRLVEWLSKVLSHLSYRQCFTFFSFFINNNRIHCTILMLTKVDIVPKCRSRNASFHSTPLLLIPVM